MTYHQAGYSVWYYSDETLGSIKECEVSGVDFATATKWFKHHITNVTANLGLTVRVIITDADDCIVAEWKYGLGIVWPEHEEMAEGKVKPKGAKAGMTWHLVHSKVDLGYLPSFLSVADPRPAREQFNERYVYGGWKPFHGFKLMTNNALVYPGDPPIHPLAQTKLRDELILLYPHDWVAIIQPDGSFEVCRMD